MAKYIINFTSITGKQKSKIVKDADVINFIDKFHVDGVTIKDTINSPMYTVEEFMQLQVAQDILKKRRN